MLRLCKNRRFGLVLVVTLALAPAVALGASGSTPAAGTWRRLPASPIAPDAGSASAVWTGRQMLAFGQATRAALNPRTNRRRRLPRSQLLSIHEGHGIVVSSG